MEYFHLAWLWIKNVFILKKPIFSQLDYGNYIAKEKSYFVITWRMKNAYRLKVKSARFKSVLKSGSAYMILPKNNDQLEIIISGSWRSQKYLIKLKQIAINEPIEFPVKLHNSFKAQLKLQPPETMFLSLKVGSFNAQIVNKKQIKTIINISYPN